MKQFDNYNSSCDYAEQIVSILYGEIDDAEKADFETHLPGCSSCAAELNGFARIRSSIGEWRAADFANLSMPVFELPSAKNEAVASIGWLEAIREYFASPVVRGSAASFAALFLVVGLLWFANGFSKGGEIAGVPQHAENKSAANDEISGHVSPLIEKTKNDTATGKAADDAPKPNVPAVDSDTENEAVKADEKIIFGKTRRAKAKKPVSAQSSRKVEKFVPKPSNKNTVPSLVVEDEEDDSLRLSDIFDEVSLK